MLTPTSARMAVYCIIALLIALLLVPALALAQTEAEITAGSPCGAPGVGRRSDGVIERIDVGIPGWHVDADEGWTTCSMPKPPADCQAPPATWTVGKHTCMAPSAPGQTRSGSAVLLRQQSGPLRGDTALQCTDGVWQRRWASCAPTRQCDLLYTMTQDGTTHVYDGRRSPVAVGAIVVATSSTAPPRRMVCNPDGMLRDAPPERPAATPSTPAQVTCGPSVERSIRIGAATPVDLEYAGPPVPADQTALFRRLDGPMLPPHLMRCTRDSRWSYVGRAPMQPQTQDPGLWGRPK